MTKRIVITGAARGLGAALAHHYAAEGWQVGLVDVNDDAGQALAEELTKRFAVDCWYQRCDVTVDADVEGLAQRVAEQWQGLDVLINNAGVAQVGAIEDVSMSDWQWIVDINLLGVVRGCRAFVPLLKRTPGSHLVNVASLAGLLDVPNMSSYNATKAAVVALSETLQHELAPAKVGVSVVCPSFFRTGLGLSMRSTVPQMDKTLDKLMSKSDLSADDIAKQIAAAVSAKTFYVLPHVKGRRLWRLKRWLPRSWYAKLMQSSSSKLTKRRK